MTTGWHVSRSGAQAGPYSWQDLHLLALRGGLGLQDLIWHQTLTGWMPATQVPGLFPMAPSAYPAPVPPASRSSSSARAVLTMILNPAQVVKDALERVPWPVCLAVSGLAFTLLFLQTGLDMHRVGTASTGAAVGFTFAGLGMGTVGVVIIAALAWALSHAMGGSRSLLWAVRGFGLAYTPALIFVLVGLVFNLAAGWNTAVAFGATGIVWALYPILAIVREMAGDKLPASLVISTICGALVLGGWALLGT